MDFINKKSLNIKTTEPHSKNLLVYVGYRGDLISKKNLFFALAQKWQLMSSFIQVREKGAKKATKMDIAQTKSDIYIHNKAIYQKSTGVHFFTSVIQFKKKKFDFGKKWQILSSFAKAPQI